MASTVETSLPFDADTYYISRQIDLPLYRYVGKKKVTECYEEIPAASTPSRTASSDSEHHLQEVKSTGILFAELCGLMERPQKKRGFLKRIFKRKKKKTDQLDDRC